MRRKRRVWSAAVIVDALQNVPPVKPRMPATRATSGSASGPSASKTRVASRLDDQRIIGVSRLRSAGLSARSDSRRR